jgi:putative MATE family efflux protein
MEHIIGLTDTAFLGRVSEVALGASALGTVYYLAFFVLGAGFGSGAQILIARRNGEKNFRATGKICYAGGFFLIIFSLLLMLAIFVFSPLLLPKVIQSPDICESTIKYLNYRTPGLLFAFAAAIFRAFYVGIAHTRILTWSSLAMVGSNLVLNYGLIFGKYGLPEMGISGAALASTVSEAVSLVCLIVYTVRCVDWQKYGFDAPKAALDPGILKNVLSVSCWMMLQPFLAVGVWFFFFIAVERLGERTLAVINLTRSLSALIFIVIHAFATATNSLVSNLIGENKVDQVWRLINKFTLLTLVSVLPLLIIFVVFPEQCLKIYTDNSDLISASVNAIYVMALASFIQIGGFVLFNAVCGTGSVKTMVFIEFANLFIYILFVYFVIVRGNPSPAVAWSSEVLYQGITAILSFAFLISGCWKHRKL